ncbi:MAG: DNA-binding CsgD family transcriptional regulator [Myxococcota bacterium]|jgi:DNA-binding CsgD family transcriptional regulator
MIHPEDREYTLELADDGQRRQQTARDVRVLHQDAPEHWISDWTAPIANASGAVSKVIGVCLDVAVRKATEDKLQRTLPATERELRAKGIELHCTKDLLARAMRAVDRRAADTQVAGATHGRLTPREHEVFHRVVRGDQNKVIAGELGIALATVKIHRGRVMAKFRVSSVAYEAFARWCSNPKR